MSEYPFYLKCGPDCLVAHSVFYFMIVLVLTVVRPQTLAAAKALLLSMLGVLHAAKEIALCGERVCPSVYTTPCCCLVREGH